MSSAAEAMRIAKLIDVEDTALESVKSLAASIAEAVVEVEDQNAIAEAREAGLAVARLKAAMDVSPVAGLAETPEKAVLAAQTAEAERAAAEAERIVAERQRRREEQESRDQSSLFEGAFLSLPQSANPRKELDWVRSHVLLLRSLRNRSSREVMPGLADIEGAPSRSAVIQLQAALGGVESFCKEMRTWAQKTVGKTPQAESTPRVASLGKSQAADILEKARHDAELRAQQAKPAIDQRGDNVSPGSAK